MARAWGHFVIALLAAPWLLHCNVYDSQCDNPNEYRVLALADGAVYERKDARIKCVEWSAGCSSAGATPGTPTTGDPASYGCRCNRQTLSAGDFEVSFEAGEVGKEVALPGGKLTITKATPVSTSCAQGDYYVDYAGTFEGEIAGKVYRRGVFYALEVK